jgi:hypothetical protein
VCNITILPEKTGEKICPILDEIAVDCASGEDVKENYDSLAGEVIMESVDKCGMKNKEEEKTKSMEWKSRCRNL